VKGITTKRTAGRLERNIRKYDVVRSEMLRGVGGN
jgi:hypothetical protein